MKINTFKPGVPKFWPSNSLVLIINSALRRISEADKRKFIMRAHLTIVFLTTCLLQVSAAGFAQKFTLSKKNISLEQVFLQVEKQTGYKVLYSDQKLNDTQKVDVNFKEASITEVMEDCLKRQNLTYKIDNKTIVIKEKQLSILDRISSFIESINIDGRIIDAETGKGIPKVTIRLKNSNRMVFSDEYGNFRFYGLHDKDILIVSSVGYAFQEVVAKKDLVVSMKVLNKELDAVVVSTGYQQLKKESTTGSYVVLTEKDIQSTPSVNLMDRLEGRVPGVLFDLRGNTIQIRGSNNYSVNTPPLIVIDGFPAIDQNLTTVTNVFNGTPSSTATNQPTTSGNAILSTFNIADIESITFLKDAAASAIWGANAANGVIVITTKRGKKGSSSINFGSTFSISSPANFGNMNTMSNKQYIDLEQELFDKGYLTDPTAYYRNAPVSEAQEWMFKVKRGTATVGQRDSALNVLANRSNRDQLKEYLLQKAVNQQYNLAFSGGADNSSYYVSGIYTKDQPVFRSNSAKTYGITSNLTNDFLNKRITVTTGLNYNYSTAQVNIAALQALSIGSYGLAPYDMLVDENGNKIYRGITLSKNVADSYTSKGYLPWTYNAIDELNYNNTISTKNAFRINSSIKGKITDWLNVAVSGQIQKNISEQTLVQNKNSYLTRELINIGTVTGTSGALSYGVPIGAVYKSATINSTDYSLRGQFNIDKKWNDTHQFNMIAGTEIRESNSRGSAQILYGYDEDRSTSVNVNTTTSGTKNGSYPTVFGSSSTLPAANGTIFRNLRRYLSYYGNGSYSYLNKYFITGSVRFDDINILGVDRRNRATPLWSGGLRWDLQKEDFMKDLKWVNALSLRGTLGTGGNPPSSSNNFSTITLSNDFVTQLPNASILTYANQDIGWSTTKMTNGGVDASLFNNRINFNLDVYSKKTYGILISVPLNSAYGISTIQYNAGDLAGHGFDLGLTGQVIRSKDWSWSQNLNFSYTTTKVTDTRFPNTNINAGQALVTGYPVDNLFVYRSAGLDNTGHSQIYGADGIVIPSNGGRALKPEDLVYAGKTSAPYFGGYLNTIRYKDLSLLVRASYYLGHKFLLKNIDGGKYPSIGSISGLLSNSKELANRWRKPGDEAFTNVPGLDNPNLNSLNWYNGSDLNVRDAGNIRLQQISLNYSVPKNFLKKMPFIKGINCGLTVSNLGLLWTANKEGVDPDYQSTDVYTNLPPTRNYVFNLNLTL